MPAPKQALRAIAECRYVGQGFELRAAMPDGPLTQANKSGRSSRTSTPSKQVYGYAFRDQAGEIITLRVIGNGGGAR